MSENATLQQPNDNRESQKQQQQICVLQNGEGLFCQLSTYEMLIKSHIFPKMIGFNSSSKNIACFISKPYLIDKYSCTYIIKHKILNYNKKTSNKLGIVKQQQNNTNIMYIAYQYLLQKMSLFLIDGHKFGGQFLAYQYNPEYNHATYLVFVQSNEIYNFCSLQHISRLAGIGKKQALIVTVNKNQGQYSIQHQQITPKMINQNKKVLSQYNCTQQLIQLKKLLGYQM